MSWGYYESDADEIGERRTNKTIAPEQTKAEPTPETRDTPSKPDDGLYVSEQILSKFRSGAINCMDVLLLAHINKETQPYIGYPLNYGRLAILFNSTDSIIDKQIKRLLNSRMLHITNDDNTGIYIGVSK